MKPSVTCLNRYLSSNGKIFINGADKQCGKAMSQGSIADAKPMLISNILGQIVGLNGELVDFDETVDLQHEIVCGQEADRA